MEYSQRQGDCMAFCLLSALCLGIIVLYQPGVADVTISQKRNLLCENFSDWSTGTQIRNALGWNAWALTANCDFVESSGTGYITDSNGAGYIYPQYTFPQGPFTQFPLSVKWRMKKTVDASTLNCYVSNAAISIWTSLSFRSDSYLSVYSGGWTQLVDAAINTWYRCEIRILSGTTFDVYINDVLYNNSGSHWTITGGTMTQLDLIAFQTATAETGVGFYLDDIEVLQDSNGMAWYYWAQASTKASVTPLINSYPLHQSDGSILVGTDAGIYRITGTSHDTWTLVDAETDAQFQCCKGGTDGHVYACVKYTAGVSTFKKSENFGATWAAMGSIGADARGDDMDNRYCLDVFRLNSKVFAVTAGVGDDAGVADPTETKLYVDELTNEVVPAWTNRGSLEFTHDSHTDHDYAKGFSYSTTVYYFAYTDDLDAQFCKYTDATNTIAIISEISANHRVMKTNCVSAIAYDSGITWTESSAGKVAVSLEAGDDHRLAYSLDGGATWTVPTTQRGMTISPYDFRQTGNTQWAYDTSYGNIWYYSTSHNHFMQINETPNGIQTIGNLRITDVPEIIGYDSGTPEAEIWHLADTASVIQTCEYWKGIFAGTNQISRCEFSTSPDDNVYFNIGDTVQFYDGYNVLAFQGVVRTKDKQPGRTLFTAEGPDAEIRRYYASDFASGTSHVKLETIVDALDFLYQSSSIDAAGYFTTSGGSVAWAYDQSENPSIRTILRLIRALERCVIYHTPAGLVYANRYDALAVTNLRVSEQCRQWLVKNLLEPTSYVTRASAYTTNTPLRQVYTGDSEKELTNGAVQALELVDNQLEANSETLQVATNLYSIFSQATTFVELVTSAQGYIQPGKTISFSYSLGGASISKAAFLVVAVYHDLKHDRHKSIMLSNNIVYPSEYAAKGLINE